MNFNRREAIRLGIGAGIATIFGKRIPKEWHTWAPVSTEYLTRGTNLWWTTGKIYNAAPSATFCSARTWARLVKDFDIQIYSRSPLLCGLLENAVDDPIEEGCRSNFMRS